MAVQWMGPAWLEPPARWIGLPWYDRVVGLYLPKRLPTPASRLPLRQLAHLRDLSVFADVNDEAPLREFASAQNIQIDLRPLTIPWENLVLELEASTTPPQADDAPPADTSFNCPGASELILCNQFPWPQQMR